MSIPGPPAGWNQATVRVVGGVILTIVGTIAYVILALSGGVASDVRGALIVFIGPLATALIASGPLETLRGTLEVVKRQTNGKTDAEHQRIAERAIANYEARKNSPEE